MSQYQKILLVLLRISLGILFLYSGLSKVLDPEWTSFGYLTHAANFSAIFNWLASPEILPIVNFLNVYGQLALGVALVLGLFVRWAGVLGAILMLFYYLALPFPKVDAHSYIVDQHIIYALALLVLGAWNSGRVWGIDRRRK